MVLGIAGDMESVLRPRLCAFILAAEPLLLCHRRVSRLAFIRGVFPGTAPLSLHLLGDCDNYILRGIGNIARDGTKAQRMVAEGIVADGQRPDSRGAVRLENVGKAFQLSPKPRSLRERLAWRPAAVPEEDRVYWALKDINLEVRPGRALGVLGLNGAGKSTLLNLIAGTLQPTRGMVEVSGHVQLLQLGAGFVPQMSGRQNVVAYARARGLSSEEIEERVAYVERFADIGPFFDQPMETYSSGMRGRVAFGNAFAVKPEILIVDEALAVGDALFANKCFRKIDEVRKEGTTILFTSHSSDAVTRLCDDGIVLHKGELIAQGTAHEAAKAYTSLLVRGGGSEADKENLSAFPEELSTEKTSASARDKKWGMHSDQVDRVSSCILYNADEHVSAVPGARIVEVEAKVNGKPCQSKSMERGDHLSLCARVYFDESIERPNFGFTLADEKNIIFYAVNQHWRGERDDPIEAGKCILYQIQFPLDVAKGDWFMSLAVADGMKVIQQRDAVLHFKVIDFEHHAIGVGWLELDFEAERF